MASTESWLRFKKRAEHFELKSEVKQADSIDVYPVLIDTMEFSILLEVYIIGVLVIYQLWKRL